MLTLCYLVAMTPFAIACTDPMPEFVAWVRMQTLKLSLNCNVCRRPMKLTTSAEDRRRYPEREYFRCERCGKCAYKDAKGAHYVRSKRD